MNPRNIPVDTHPPIRETNKSGNLPEFKPKLHIQSSHWLVFSCHTIDYCIRLLVGFSLWR